MKRILFIAFTILSFAIIFTACNNTPESNLAADEAYSCSMHPQVLREAPGQCPICNMDLTKRKITPAEAEKLHKDSSHLNH